MRGRLDVRPRGKSQRLERVLTDFGCEHSFGRAVSSVREHYGFELGATAVRTATLKHAQPVAINLELTSPASKHTRNCQRTRSFRRMQLASQRAETR